MRIKSKFSRPKMSGWSNRTSFASLTRPFAYGRREPGQGLRSREAGDDGWWSALRVDQQVLTTTRFGQARIAALRYHMAWTLSGRVDPRNPSVSAFQKAGFRHKRQHLVSSFALRIQHTYCTCQNIVPSQMLLTPRTISPLARGEKTKDVVPQDMPSLGLYNTCTTPIAPRLHGALHTHCTMYAAVEPED